MRFFQLACTVLFLALLHGCTRYYGPSNLASHAAMVAHPSPRDSTQKQEANYVQGGYGYTRRLAYNSGEANEMATLRAYRGWTRKYFNAHAGAYGFRGRYRVTQLDDYAGDYDHQGYGLFAGANYRNSGVTRLFSGRWESRLLGLRIAYQREQGAFRDLRGQLQRLDIDSISIVNANGVTGYCGIYSETCLFFNKTGISLGAALGAFSYDNMSFNNYDYNSSWSFGFHRPVWGVQAEVNSGVGIFSTLGNTLTSFRAYYSF